VIQRHRLRGLPGRIHVGDRRVNSAILHVLKRGSGEMYLPRTVTQYGLQPLYSPILARHVRATDKAVKPVPG
jgi:hypothetical protein